MGSGAVPKSQHIAGELCDDTDGGGAKEKS